MLADQTWLSVGGWITFVLTSVALVLTLRRVLRSDQSFLARVGPLLGPLATLLLSVAMIQRLQSASTPVYLIGGGLLAAASLVLGIRNAQRR